MRLRPSDPDGYLRLSHALAPPALGGAPPPPPAALRAALRAQAHAATLAPHLPTARGGAGGLRLSIAAAELQAAAADFEAALALTPADPLARSAAGLTRRALHQPEAAASHFAEGRRHVRGALGGGVAVDWVAVGAALRTEGWAVARGVAGGEAAAALERRLHGLLSHGTAEGRLTLTLSPTLTLTLSLTLTKP